MFMAGQVSIGRKTGARSVELENGVNTDSFHETRWERRNEIIESKTARG